MKGIVFKNAGSLYNVRTEDGKFYLCHIKGNFRIKGIKSTNPIAVGDVVEFKETDEGEGLIHSIEERRNYVVRKPSNLSKQLHIIAANVDQALLIATIAHPETSLVFIDRFLATCEAYNVKAILVINKTDLLEEEDNEYLDALINLYSSIGYKCVKTSAVTGEGVDELKQMMQNKTTLLSGNSGVGKSSLINAVCPDFNAKTGEISAVHDTGMHTTTFSEMYELDHDTLIIDTPGVKGFGTIDFDKYQVGHYFPEIFKASEECRFGNCTHTHEPGCAVLKAVEDHFISESRYNSYLSILDDSEEGKYREKL